MKKYTTLIIAIFLFFSSTMSLFAANNGYIGNIFELQTGPEVMKLKTAVEKVQNFNFKSARLHNKLQQFKTADKLLLKELTHLYEDGHIGYYSMNSITKNYNLFVYHTNRMFYYESVKEVAAYKQLDSIIHSHYTKARNYYNKVQFTIKKEKEQKSRRNLFEIYN